MNSQTRGFYPHNASTKVSKGTPVPKGPKPDAMASGALDVVFFPSVKGEAVNSGARRANAGRKPWKGHGDCLRRDGVIYENVIGTVVPFTLKVA